MHAIITFNILLEKALYTVFFLKLKYLLLNVLFRTVTIPPLSHYDINALGDLQQIFTVPCPLHKKLFAILYKIIGELPLSTCLKMFIPANILIMNNIASYKLHKLHFDGKLININARFKNVMN